MDQSPRKIIASEAATVPPTAPTAGPTIDRVAPITDGPRTTEAACAVLVPPELIDHARYRVLALLGQGGMGAVYKAEHKRMERLVALKVVNPSLVHDKSSVQRFHQEVRAAARLHHPNIVTAFDADQAGDLHFLVMEFVE
ncbi:MAG TPA: protein kinase, partial [Gemmataceae bacterium]|nr:protein kinase [Gemmataceae bacterium]